MRVDEGRHDLTKGMLGSGSFHRDFVPRALRAGVSLSAAGTRLVACSGGGSDNAVSAKTVNLWYGRADADEMVHDKFDGN